MRWPVLLLLPVLSGCGGLRDHCAHAGWRFEVLKPPTIASEALVQSSGQTLGILGAGSGGLRGEIAALTPPPALPQAAGSEVSAYEFESLRFAISMILRRLDNVERATAPTMPPAKSQPEQLKSPPPCR